MKLTVPTKDDCEWARLWRNENMVSLRTPYELTREIQEDFYKNVVCNPKSPHKYWAISSDETDENKLPFNIGFGGLTFIEWENRLARISLIIDPVMRKHGFGEKAVELILDKAFNYLNLKTVCGECYLCNPAKLFWEKIVQKYKSHSSFLPNKKYWNGKYWNAIYFSIDKDEFYVM